MNARGRVGGQSRERDLSGFGREAPRDAIEETTELKRVTYNRRP
jgi:hypothetical protein